MDDCDRKCIIWRLNFTLFLKKVRGEDHQNPYMCQLDDPKATPLIDRGRRTVRLIPIFLGELCPL